jgi:hypothetical protein
MAPPVFPGDADEAAASYLNLSRIALVMEEEEEDDVALAELSPDHPALLHAQQPFSQILSGAPFSPDQGPVFPGDRGSPNHGGGHEKEEYSTDMFTAAFFRGVDEATKFLPADTADKPLRSKESAGGRGRRDRYVGGEQEAEAGRASKLATAESEEASARELFDEMMLRGIRCLRQGDGGPDHFHGDAHNGQQEGGEEDQDTRQAPCRQGG